MSNQITYIQKISTLNDPKRSDLQDVARNIDADLTNVIQKMNLIIKNVNILASGTTP